MYITVLFLHKWIEVAYLKQFWIVWRLCPIPVMKNANCARINDLLMESSISGVSFPSFSRQRASSFRTIVLADQVDEWYFGHSIIYLIKWYI